MTTLALCELIEDLSIYPRHGVDDANVTSLAHALRAGVTLPPIVADATSKRIVDGWHRARAYRRVIGLEAVVNVDLQEYADENAILLDAIRRNASHGRRFDAIDQVRAATLCAKRGIPLESIAAVLHLPEERVQKLTVRLAQAPRPGPGTVTGTPMVALKRPLVHLQGKELTTKQVAAHDRAPGVSYLLIANQLAEAVSSDVGFINQADDRLINALRALHKALGSFLGSIKSA